MTDSDISGAAQPTAEDDAEKAAAERPAWRRSVFFDHEERIRSLLADGRSYQQILRILGLKKMHRSVLARWCQRRGLRSKCPARPGSRPDADKKSAAQAPAAPRPAEATPVSLADAYGPEPLDPLAELRHSSSSSRSPK